MAGESVKPVLLVEEGSGGKQQIGSLFVLAMGKHRIVVTAAHVVQRAQRTLFGVTASRTSPWPTSYKVLTPVNAAYPDADVAYFTGVPNRGSAARATESLPIEAADVVEERPGMSFIAMGYPLSRNKLRDAQTRLRSGRMSVLIDSIAHDAYAALKLDPRVHLACRYDPKDRVDEDGEEVTGAHPRGMSGGVLLAPSIEQSSAKKAYFVMRVAGVITLYHPAPANILVATRIQHLLDAIAADVGALPAQTAMYRAVSTTNA